MKTGSGAKLSGSATLVFRYGAEGSRPKTGKKDSDEEEEEDFKVNRTD